MTSSDPMLENRVAALVNRVLDAETGPHRSWADSPAAKRIASGEIKGIRLPRPPLRMLAIAAVLVVGGAAAAVGAYRLLEQTPTPVPSLPVAVVSPRPSTTPQPSDISLRNGWLAYTEGGGLVVQKPFPFEQIFVRGVGSERPCPQFGAGGLLAVADNPPTPNELRWDITTISLPEERTSPTTEYDVVDSIAINERPDLEVPCFEWSPDGTRFAYTTMLGADGLFTIVDQDESQSVSPFTVSRDVKPPIPDIVRWKPDGSMVAYAYSFLDEDAGGFVSALVLAPADGSGPVQELTRGAGGLLQEDTEVINDLAWSPDGSQIAVRGTTLAQADDPANATPTGAFVRILTIQPDGLESSLVDSADLEVSLAAGPAWSPDGTQLAWVLDGELRIGLLSLGFGDFRRMPPMLSDDPATAWANEPLIWSADGSQILVGQANLRSIGPGVQTTAVIYEANRNRQPQRILPWSRDGYGRITWQVLGE